MKRRTLAAILVLALVLALLCGSASAAVLTDAPGTPTQDRAIALEAHWEDEASTAYDLHEMPAHQLTMDEAVDVYDFVYEEGNRPVRWYPEETQKAIEEMIGFNPDSLYMTEFMRMEAPAITPETTLDATLTLTIEYQVGQLTVVVLGDITDPANIVWTPVESSVTAVGVVEFKIPKELMETLQGEDFLFTLLTVRSGNGGSAEVKATETPESVPSKQASDTTRVVETTGKDGEVKPDDFELKVAPETDPIKREIELLGQYVTEKEQSALSWLPEEDQNRVRYLLGVDGDDLIVTDYVSLVTEDFRDTDGDAVGTLSFATPYTEGQVIVTALGIPDETADTTTDETHMKWSVQPAIVRANGVVDVVFDQVALIDMDTDTGLLLVLSQPETETAE